MGIRDILEGLCVVVGMLCARCVGIRIAELVEGLVEMYDDDILHIAVRVVADAWPMEGIDCLYMERIVVLGHLRLKILL